jgi:hypothetical protein
MIPLWRWRSLPPAFSRARTNLTGDKISVAGALPSARQRNRLHLAGLNHFQHTRNRIRQGYQLFELVGSRPDQDEVV